MMAVRSLRISSNSVFDRMMIESRPVSNAPLIPELQEAFTRTLESGRLLFGPEVEAFEREANRVWESGRRHYSARTIGEYLRHESALRQEEPDEDFKLNNNIFPSLARIYMAMHPERFGFFERRPGGSAVRAL